MSSNNSFSSKSSKRPCKLQCIEWKCIAMIGNLKTFESQILIYLGKSDLASSVSPGVKFARQAISNLCNLCF